VFSPKTVDFGIRSAGCGGVAGKRVYYRRVSGTKQLGRQ